MVNLTAKTSLAIDRRYWAFGTPIWLDLDLAAGTGKYQPENWAGLMIAQDTGSAIRGIARGDVFWGTGDKAADKAGPMKATGSMIALLPRNLASKLID